MMKRREISDTDSERAQWTSSSLDVCMTFALLSMYEDNTPWHSQKTLALRPRLKQVRCEPHYRRRVTGPCDNAAPDRHAKLVQWVVSALACG